MTGSQFDQGKHPRSDSTGRFTEKFAADPGNGVLADGPNVTAAYFRADGLAWVEFEPTPVESGGHRIMLTSAYTWTVNGPSYLIGRGRIIKKDGTVGSRILESGGLSVPETARRAMADLFTTVPDMTADVTGRITSMLPRLDTEQLDPATAADLAKLTADLVDQYRSDETMTDLITHYDQWNTLHTRPGQQPDLQDRDTVMLWAFTKRLGIQR